MTSVLVFLFTLLLVSVSLVMGLIAMSIGRVGNLPYSTGFLWGSALGPLGVLTVVVFVLQRKSYSFRNRAG